MLKVGDKMPPFEVVDQDGQVVRSSDFIGNGRKTIVYFYPKDNTSGCTAEACSFRDNCADGCGVQCGGREQGQRQVSHGF